MRERYKIRRKEGMIVMRSPCSSVRVRERERKGKEGRSADLIRVRIPASLGGRSAAVDMHSQTHTHRLTLIIIEGGKKGRRGRHGRRGRIEGKKKANTRYPLHGCCKAVAAAAASSVEAAASL